MEEKRRKERGEGKREIDRKERRQVCNSNCLPPQITSLGPNASES